MMGNLNNSCCCRSCYKNKKQRLTKDEEQHLLTDTNLEINYDEGIPVKKVNINGEFINFVYL